jgi:ABC-2 type transport system permease protein
MTSSFDALSGRSFTAVSRSSGQSRFAAAYADLRQGVAMHELWLFLGWRDIKKHYSRSLLGPLWLTLSMGIMIAGLGVLYSAIFKMEIATYLPFLAIGFIMWGLIGTMITNACTVFSNAAGPIRQIRLPYSVYIFQFAWTQFVTFCHNFVIYVFVALIFGIWPTLATLLLVPALALILLNGIFVAMILGPLCARFRDIPMIVASIVQVSFFMTPILWSATQVPERAVFVGANPFYHFIEIARDPLLGSPATLVNWAVCFAITMFLGIVAFLFFARYRARIAYWA